VGKKAQLEPGWLVALLGAWARHDLKSESGGLGFASGSSWMQGLKSSPASSIDPTGWAAGDFRDLEASMDRLLEAERELWAAVTMYYKPWVIRAFVDEGFPFQNGTYYDRLHRAHAWLATEMNRRRDARQAQAQATTRSVRVPPRSPGLTLTLAQPAAVRVTRKKARSGPVAARERLDRGCPSVIKCSHSCIGG
jgi:hypothetical protein